MLLILWKSTSNPEEMLQTLITSRTRIKLLMKFFLNSRTTSYLRDLETEFGESSNAIRVELNRLEGAGLLNSRKQGNKKIFQANREHPLFGSIHELLLKHTGIDHIIDKVVNGLGGLQQAYVISSFARGRDNPVIDLLLVGEAIDKSYLVRLADKAEGIIGRHIRYVIIRPEETEAFLKIHPEALLLWEDDGG